MTQVRRFGGRPRGRRWARWLRVWLSGLLLAAGLPARGQAAALPTQGQAAASAPVMGWQSQLVDQRGNVGAGLSMDLSLGANARPQITYYDLTSDRSLKYATWDGVAWTTDVVDPDLGPIDASGLPLATGISGFGDQVRIVYQSYDVAAGAAGLRYAVGRPGNWKTRWLTPAVRGRSPYAPAMRGDPNLTLHLSYTLRQGSGPSTSDQVIYARLDLTGTDWLTQTVDARDHPPASGLVTSLALDGSLPQIVYGSTRLAEAGPLTWARRAGALWQTAVVTDSAFLPAIAIDTTGTPHLAFQGAGPAAATLQYAKWTGGAWQFQQVCACVSDDNQPPTIALNDVNLPTLTAESKTNLIALHLDVGAWHGSQLPGSSPASRSVLAFDLAGNPHIAYYSPLYGDLYYVGWSPDWITQTVAPSGDEARLAVDLQALPYISYSATTPPSAAHHVSLTQWIPGSNWQTRVALPFSAPGSVLQLNDLGTGQTTPILAYRDDSDPARPHAGYAAQDAKTGAFVTTTVDGADGTGLSTALYLDPQFTPVIAYLDMGGDIPRIRRAAWSPNPKGFGQWFDIYTDTASFLQDASPLAGGAAPVCCGDYIAYYDLLNNTLRMATWDGAHWSDMVVDDLGGQVISPSLSLAVDQTTGEPAIAYTGSGQSEIRYAVWRGGSFLTQTVASGLQAAGDVSLTLVQSSDEYPRIAYTERVDKALRLAWTTPDTSTWTLDTVTTFTSDPTLGQRVRVSSQVQQRDQLAFSSPDLGVVYAYRAATLPFAVGYNPLQPCLDAQAPPLAALGHTLAQVRALSPAALSQVDDLTALRALRDLFALTPGGQHYINLYYQFSTETGALGLANPGLAWDAYRTLQNFLPGALALATGQGNRYVITQAMVDQVNNIADRLAAAGSPALASAIAAERAKYHHLQDFSGKTFAQAASLMGVDGYRSYLPIVGR